MSEGVQASPNPAVGNQHGLSGAIVPIVMGLVSGFGAWDVPSGSVASSILLFTGIGLVAVGVAIVVLRRIIQDPRDYYGGLALLGLALFAIWASSDLPGMHGFAFGPGTAPRLFAGILGGSGAAVALVGCFSEGPGLERFAIRGPVFITLSTIVFAVTIRHFGLVVASFISILVSAAGSNESRWLETIIWGAFLTAFCAFLFPYALNLPMPLWPQNLSFSASMFSIR
jgi:putative tricarboxylic transport membrane protein